MGEGMPSSSVGRHGERESLEGRKKKKKDNYLGSIFLKLILTKKIFDSIFSHITLPDTTTSITLKHKKKVWHTTKNCSRS